MVRRVSFLLLLSVVVSFAAAGPVSAAPASELLGPDGPYRGRAPVGYMLVVHGGGWTMVGREAMDSMRADVDRYRRRGWAVLNVTYRPGADSMTDVERFYRQLRARARGRAVCADGASAGGHLVLMLAHRHPQLNCVIATGAPTDLGSLPAAPHPVRVAAERYFGPRGGLDAWSPARLSLRVPTLAAAAAEDLVVPSAQTVLLAQRHPRVARSMLLGSGSQPFIHRSVDGDDLRAFHAAEAQLMRDAAKRADARLAKRSQRKRGSRRR